MTKAVFSFQNKRITAFEIIGHTGYADAGNDVLCAFISASAETVVNCLTDSFGVKVCCIADEKDARVACRLDEESAESAYLFDRMAYGLRLQLSQLMENYPESISIVDVEV